jgi:hypothetical protein
MVGPVSLPVGDVAVRGNHPEIGVPPTGHRKILGPTFGVLVTQDRPDVHSFRRGLHTDPLGGGRTGIEVNEDDVAPLDGDHC